MFELSSDFYEKVLVKVQREFKNSSSYWKFELSGVRVIGSVLYILFIVMTDKSVQIVNKPAFLEVSYGEVLIPIAINIPIEFSPASPVLPKAPTMGHLPSNEATNIQH